jgi:hypothetical protein
MMTPQAIDRMPCVVSLNPDAIHRGVLSSTYQGGLKAYGR